MTTSDLKTHVQELLRENKFQRSFDLLWGNISRESNSFSILTNLAGSWRETKDEYQQGIIGSDDKARRFSQSRTALLEFVNDLKDGDLKEIKEDKIATRLLVITPSKDTEKAMCLFFPFEYFRDIVFVRDERHQDEIEDEDDAARTKYDGVYSVVLNDKYQLKIKDDDLVVFDNFEHPRIEITEVDRLSQLEKLKWVLNNTDCFIIWFGSYGEIVKENNDRIYAANFRFALYARIKEMIDFLKYYHGA